MTCWAQNHSLIFIPKSSPNISLSLCCGPAALPLLLPPPPAPGNSFSSSSKISLKWNQHQPLSSLICSSTHIISLLSECPTLPLDLLLFSWARLSAKMKLFRTQWHWLLFTSCWPGGSLPFLISGEAWASLESLHQEVHHSLLVAFWVKVHNCFLYGGTVCSLLYDYQYIYNTTQHNTR